MTVPNSLNRHELAGTTNWGFYLSCKYLYPRVKVVAL